MAVRDEIDRTIECVVVGEGEQLDPSAYKALIRAAVDLNTSA